MKVSKIILLSISLAIVSSCTRPVYKESNLMHSISPNDLAFLGTVTSIKSSRIPNSSLNWIVRCNVEKVLSGIYEKDTFSFRVHSPTRSGLSSIGRLTVVAKKNNNGYSVDENQWMKKFNVDDAIDIAKQAVEKNEQWGNKTIYKATKEGDKWSVTAWRVIGYAVNGKPILVPGNYVTVIIGSDGKVESYFIGG